VAGELTKRFKKAGRRLMALSDAQLRKLNANLSAVPEGDTLFRILRKKGDTENLSKFFNRTLTEEEYVSLMEKNKKEYVKERAKEHGIRKDTPSDTTLKKPEKTDGKKQTALVRQIESPRTLSKVFNLLSIKGWTLYQISDALTVCESVRLPSKKLVTLAKLNVGPHAAPAFLNAHDEMRSVGLAAANSHKYFSFDTLAEIYEWVDRDIERFEEFLDFCREREQQISKIKNNMQLGNRGRLRDLRVALKSMFEIFDITHGSATDVSNLNLLEELSPVVRQTTVSEDGVDTAAMKELIEGEVAIMELSELGITPSDDEERLMADQGNMNMPRRRRRGGF